MTSLDTPKDDLPPTTINGLAYGVFPSLAMLAAMQLDLFTQLSRGASTLPKLAHALGAAPDKLVPLLDLLATSGLVVRAGDRIENSAEAERYLVSGRPDSRVNMAPFYEGLWRAAMSTAESIRGGEPAARLDFAGLDEQALSAFFERQYPSSLAGGKELAGLIPLHKYRRIADLGGGTGGTSIGLCAASASLHSTLYDLPSVVKVTTRFVGEAGLQDRIEVVAADLVGSQCDGDHDAAVIRSVLQVLDPESARAVLRNAHRLLRPGGDLIICGSVLEDSRRGPASALARGLVFLNVYDHGASYTQAEHFAWLAETGFEAPEIGYACMRDGTSVIRATRRA